MTGKCDRPGLGPVRQPARVPMGPGQRRRLPRIGRAIARRIPVVTDAPMPGDAAFRERTDGSAAAGGRRLAP